MSFSSVNFDGVRYDSKSNVSFLTFSRTDNKSTTIVEVPVTSDIAARVMKYLERLSCNSLKPAERGNDEPSS